MYEVKRRKPGRHWFALLTCLLLLSLAAPTLWDSGNNPFRAQSAPESTAEVPVAKAEASFAPPTHVLSDDKIEQLADRPFGPIRIMATSTKSEDDSDAAPVQLIDPTPAAVDNAVVTPVVDPMDTAPDSITELLESPIEPVVADLAEVDAPTIPQPSVTPLLPRVKSTLSKRRGPIAQPTSLDPPPSMSRADGWPLPAVLLEQLDALTIDPAVAPWAFDVINMIEQLNQISLIDNTSASAVLERMQAAVERSEKLADEVDSEDILSQLRRAAYAVSRRLATWQLANGVFTQDVLAAVDSLKPNHDRLAMLHLDKAKPGSLLGPLGAGEPFVRIRPEPLILEPDPNQHETSPPLVPTALNGMDRVKSLLVTLERYEETRLPRDGHVIARHINDLTESTDATRQALAQHLKDHYRNANFRLTILSQLFDEMLPKLKPQESEVDDYIAGAAVWGWQETSARMHTQFIPDGQHIRMRVGVKGAVTSDTEANSGPATLFTVGQTDYNTSRDVIISQRGLAMTPTRATADAYSNLTGLETDYDGVPLLGSVVEKVARKKYGEQKWQAMAEVEQRVAREAKEQFEKEFTPKIVDAARKFHAQVWTPLIGLGLDPTAVEMRSTDQRMVTRFILSADDQLAAHTARPRAPSDSLASMQIHESMLNNALDQFQLNGKTFTLPELHHHIAKRLGQPETKAPEEFDKRVKIGFAKHDAVRVRCEDGAVELTLSLTEISRGKKYHWENLVVRARYQPEGTGLEANLTRQDSIELIGENLRTRDQIALRGVFSKLLSKSRHAVLVPKNVADHEALGQFEVIQFLVNDGWIGVAIGPHLPTSNNGEKNAARAPRWRLGHNEGEAVKR